MSITNPWFANYNAVNIQEHDLNKLILNYFVVEGYKEAATQFSQESMQPLFIDEETMECRTTIRDAIQTGNVEEAKSLINDLDSDILENNKELVFLLQLQILIENIRNEDMNTALAMAQELAPLAELEKPYREELEHVMSCMVFKDPLLRQAEKLDVAQIEKVLSCINQSILSNMSQEKDSKLPMLLKMCAFGQHLLDQYQIEYPKMDVKQGLFEQVDGMEME
eukprot:NODE_261_length_11439_cov_1.285538.p6 type:complete len:223 gc:universal NODE_261_length_11439_cov_1.285538:1373-705(-)